MPGLRTINGVGVGVPLSVLAADGVTWQPMRTVPKRTNLIPRYDLASSSSWGVARLTASPDPTVRRTPGSPPALKIQGTSDLSGSYVIEVAAAATTIPIPASRVVTLGWSVLADSTSAGPYSCLLYLYDSTFKLVAAAVTLGTISAVAGVWSDLRVTYTPPAAAAYIRYGIQANGASGVGKTAWIANPFAVEGSYPGEYFDGATPADADYTYSWTGAAQQSTAIATP